MKEKNGKEYTLSQQYAIVGLDGLEVLHITIAKRAVLRAVKAAQLLDGEPLEELEPTGLKLKLSEGLKQLKNLKKKEALELEKEAAGMLEADGVLEEVPDLLGCDMDYDTAGIDIRAYRSDRDVYMGITERVRAEILEEGPVTRECICLIWLFRESGCIHDIFSTEEQTVIESRMLDMGAKDEFCSILWGMEFHNGLEYMAGSLLKGKRNLFRNPYLEGVNLLFPFLDRRRSIFIDFVVFGTNVKNRRMALINILIEKGHYVEEVKRGTETFLRIDNSYYRVWPTTITISRVPVQGARLLPVYQ